MSETKHTKGPWGVGEKRGDHVDINHYDNSKGAISKVIALVTSRVTWLEESRANANLIASAPEMYDFIESLENDNDQIPGFMWKMRDEILAKARGEES